MNEPKPAERLKNIAKHVEIRMVRLERCSAEFLGLRVGEAPNVIHLALGGGGLRSPDAAQHIRCVVEANVDAYPNEGKEHLIARASARFALDYAVQDKAVFDGITDEDLKEFASVNAVHNAWPYLREYFHSVAGRMAIGSIILPSFKVKGVEPLQLDPAE